MPDDEIEELLVDGQHGHGASRDPEDDRDFSYDEVALGGPVKIDFEKGYDIRNELGGDISIKNQFASLSCVGQGWAYYFWVKMVKDLMKKYSMTLPELRVAHAQEVDEISAKAIYSLISLGFGRGATIRAGALLGLKYGALQEKFVPSYHDGVTDEHWMFSKAWKTAALDKLAETLKGKEARTIVACDNMDLFALAIQDNQGVVGGVTGANGHGWGYAEEVTPPSAGDDLWGHCLFYGAYGIDELGKFIATPNSWGQFVKRPQGPWQPGFKPGYGWQKLRKNYFTQRWQFNPWTYTTKPSELTEPEDEDTEQFVYVFEKQLLYGMRNDEVKMLQKALVWLDRLEPRFVTGYYGDVTAGALLRFQLDNAIDSVASLKKLKGRRVGPKTLAYLNRIFSAGKKN